jgi:hypothetical protein
MDELLVKQKAMLETMLGGLDLQPSFKSNIISLIEQMLIVADNNAYEEGLADGIAQPDIKFRKCYII